ncbi:aspartate/glutamate racemase family protein [Piscinibacter sp.]|uniref:aspartate/glutamate racemase family protein n=1 Tax=Piscinibacter sp. TaxID=1903157 RepID=UPI002B6E6129|nr:aspartate/glutamate racemase family protein [Albitalea sp.]HUG23750.1 aspartate/glutamate racemase family protein [Albitalea sp.]
MAGKADTSMNDSRHGFLGILMLDTRFPRPVGDVGNPETYRRAGIPVRFVTVQGASPERIVKEADPALLRPFVDAAVQLVRDGAQMLSTSCGFLSAYQEQLSRAVAVPVITSSLLQAARFSRPGIVTIAAASLGPSVLHAAGVPAGTPVQGVEPGCEFHHRILSNDATLDLKQAEHDVVAAAVELVRIHPLVTDIVLECTNMPPYRDAVVRETGRAVHDIETLLIQEWAGRRLARHSLVP